ncbi:Rha family transcriptional regulator [Aerococcus sp. UMB1112A]|uniref:Rha family transcriptional regulator n=1 Tax=Aerococcus sp. UMB1112A TaxID=3050609 RepID=UPI00254AB9FE|nr:Rha family transcriptional regulator [Aerococcus sp. UMB1112A]MDK8502122.1 Rha family transcriptional regulator [Aerococcus sp. UMB1112A]
MQLVYLENGKEAPYTLSSIVAECAEVQHKAVKNLIYKYKTDLEELGVLTFQNAKPLKGSKGGRPGKDYRLTEPQATLLITWLDNTEPVREFKKALVKEFYQMREQIKHFEVQRQIEKVIHKELNEAISRWQYVNKFAYSNIASLLCRTITGLSTVKLRERENAPETVPALDLMSGDELTKYREQATLAIMYLNQQCTYEELKRNLCQHSEKSA